mgnify:CR=1 FL=1
MAHDVKLGALIEGEQQRDAIHIAVAPVIAAERLFAGQAIGLVSNDMRTVSSKTEQPIGIVDPFLRGPVQQGQQFWMFLYPQTITSLRHDWTHPAFVEAASMGASEVWLRNFCAMADCPDYETVLAAATGGDVVNVDAAYYDVAYRNDGEYLHFGGRDAHSEIPPEFWDHIEVVSGKKIPQSRRASSFSCSC